MFLSFGALVCLVNEFLRFSNDSAFRPTCESQGSETKKRIGRRTEGRTDGQTGVRAPSFAMLSSVRTFLSRKGQPDSDCELITPTLFPVRRSVGPSVFISLYVFRCFRSDLSRPENLQSPSRSNQTITKRNNSVLLFLNTFGRSDLDHLPRAHWRLLAGVSQSLGLSAFHN